jgi:hypothetical protein
MLGYPKTISGKNSIDQTFWDFWYPKRLVECIVSGKFSLGYRVSCKLFIDFRYDFHENSWIFTWIFMKFYMIFIKFLHRFSSKFTKPSKHVRNCSRYSHYNLKTAPTPLVPLPHFPKAVKLGSEPKNRENALRGPDFLSSRPPPQSKNLG